MKIQILAARKTSFSSWEVFKEWNFPEDNKYINYREIHLIIGHLILKHKSKIRVVFSDRKPLSLDWLAPALAQERQAAEAAKRF